MSDPFATIALELAALVEALPRVAARTAPELLAVVKGQHAGGVAPDGSAWAPTKAGGVALLSLTSQTTARAEGAAVVLELSNELLPHQVGSARLPRRQVVPDPFAELPMSWREPFDEAVRAELGAG